MKYLNCSHWEYMELARIATDEALLEKKENSQRFHTVLSDRGLCLVLNQEYVCSWMSHLSEY